MFLMTPTVGVGRIIHYIAIDVRAWLWNKTPYIWEINEENKESLRTMVG
jgi:hypothetical protein